tara:strand:- start:341 stop:640 length:300 start_codon:yes stop_codon:yes gene_type:complete
MELNMAEDRTKEVNDLVGDILAGNNADAQEKFNAQMTSRAQEAIDDMKSGIATDVFNKHVVDPDMEPQGVALDDALVDIDQTTGRPVEEPEQGETNEDI